MTTYIIQNLSKIQKLLLFVMAVLALISCQEEVTIDLYNSGNERIAVDGRITNVLKRHKIRLTRTRGYLENIKVPPLLNANAYILEKNSGKTYNLTLSDSVNGIYLTPEFKGTTGETYSLIVHSDSNTYEATTYMDTVTALDSIKYEYEYSDLMQIGYYKIFMSAYDPPTTNYYRFSIFLNDTLVNYKITDASYTDDQLFNGYYMAYIEIYDMRQEWVRQHSNTLKVEILSMSKFEYDNINDYMSEIYGNGSIFTGPSANIPSNLKNMSGGLDGLGFFGASAVYTLEMPLIKSHGDSTNVADFTTGVWIMN
jgi:hypothetical protein